MEDMFYGNVGSGGALSESAHVEPEPQHQQPKKQKQPKQNGEGVVTKAKKMFDRFFE
jgi:cell division protein FtsA